MMPTTLAPRDGRALVIPPGMKCCKACEQTLPVEYFYAKHCRGYVGLESACKECVAKRKFLSHLERRERAEGERPPSKIPDSDCAIQLTIISACWLSCVEVGAEAIRRMMDRLVDATYLPGSVTTEERARLRNAVQSYRVGATALDFVERTLHSVDVARRA